MTDWVENQGVALNLKQVVVENTSVVDGKLTAASCVPINEAQL
ncbi:hypothetical protein SAMN05216228_10293 [Rhizobium tibeticum]|uniref:Uncharacterized protein n=1 Tax=Rhizobium tibeticum TaxID=501024 RepID=A0A1H8TI83_9HYPH|nr:hypothetical protein [Rhizobium tibeticum]SEI15145.1 hypothetical protein RTCCBAU85039_5208 [Rhizobium tibeticum]SEO90597.1 hypothetical protein SAMN05216228_10293 [Rhizobium tibeticum]